MTTYPTSFQDLDATRGTASDTLSQPSHVAQHTLEDGTIEAIQTKLGIDSSADTASIDYKLKNTSSVNPGHKHTLAGALTDVEITSPADGAGLFYDTASGKWKDGSTSVADSSTTVKGVTKLSVAPVSATEPIAVGDNDTRFVTSSGTALSGSNKVIDEGDVSNAAGSGKIVRASGTALPALDGSALVNVQLETVIQAGESISNTDACTLIPYSTDGGVLLDFSSATTGTWSSNGQTITYSVTVANNSNRILVVSINGTNGAGYNAPASGSVTFNGTAMTILGSQKQESNLSTGWSTYYLLAPSVGTYNVSFTLTAGSFSSGNYGIHVYSFYNAAQSAPTETDGTISNGTTSISYAAIASSMGAVGLGIIGGWDTSGVINLNPSNVSNTTTRIISSTSTPQLTTGSKTFSATTTTALYSSSSAYYWAILIYPYTTASVSIGKTKTTNNIGTERSIFIGFPNSSYTAGQNASIKVGGVKTGLSGLTPGVTYYLSDTAGAISTSAGTVSRKIGIALSATTLLIKHDNV